MDNFDCKCCYEWIKDKLGCKKDEPVVTKKPVKKNHRKSKDSVESLCYFVPPNRNAKATMVDDSLLVMMEKMKIISNIYKAQIVLDPPIIHKIKKIHYELGKILAIAGEQMPAGEAVKPSFDQKLKEIEGKVDKILKAPKKHEKRLFDVDINLNISTEGEPHVKAVSSGDRKSLKKGQKINKSFNA